MSQINLGDRVKDNVTGFTGVVIASTKWLNGCIRHSVQPEKLQEGKMVESAVFDEPQLSVIKRGVVSVGTPETGGPIPTPRQHAAQTRY